MSNVKIKANASGSADFTIEAPATNSELTLTLPSVDGELLTTTGDGSNLTGISGGKVLQVVSTTKTSTQSTTSNTWVDITSLSLNITPSSTSSKIYISTNITASCGGSGINNGLRLLRDATELSLSTQSSTALGFIRDVENSGNGTRDLMFHILDTPSTTSQITYKWQFQTSGGYTYYIGAPQNNTTNFNLYLTMVAMEIAG